MRVVVCSSGGGVWWQVGWWVGLRMVLCMMCGVIRSDESVS